MERLSRLIDQLSQTFEELEASAMEDALAAERTAAKTTMVRGFTCKRGERQTFPEHLPRERVVSDPPTSCECCGGNQLHKLDEDVTRTLESTPRQWKVDETVREKSPAATAKRSARRPRRSMLSQEDGPVRGCSLRGGDQGETMLTRRPSDA